MSPSAHARSIVGDDGGSSPPLVSVILPTYNWSTVLRHSIRTVLWQSFADFELLVVGDACDDDTEDVVAGFREPRIRWHNLERNSGNQAAPNNAGLAMARGKYVAYAHQDDLWMPEHLSVLVRALEEDERTAAHTLILDVGPPPDRIRRVVGLPGGGTFGADKVELFTPAVMHRTDAARRIGGWADWRGLREGPYFDFLKRLIRSDRDLVSVRELTVVKFHAGLRPNSYVDRRSEEQAEYVERILSEPDFRARELLHAMEDGARGRRLQALAHWSSDSPPGAYMEQHRRVRGLPPLPATIPRRERSLREAVLRPARKLRDVMPGRLRRWLGHALSRAGRSVAGDAEL